MEATNPEAIVCARVREVDDKLERFVVKRFQREKNMVDQQITIHV